jgi:hypothetical protein
MLAALYCQNKRLVFLGRMQGWLPLPVATGYHRPVTDGEQVTRVCGGCAGPILIFSDP